jgi:membrane-bound lytic murein transglycosylase B
MITPKLTNSVMSWDKYKGLFITENRIKNGIKFWQDNLATLDRAEKIAELALNNNHSLTQRSHLSKLSI